MLEAIIKSRDERLIKEKEEQISLQNKKAIDELHLEQEIKLRRQATKNTRIAVFITVFAVAMSIIAVWFYMKSNSNNRTLREQQEQLAKKQIDLNSALLELNTKNRQLLNSKAKGDSQNIALMLKSDSLIKQQKILSDQQEILANQKEVLSDQKNKLSIKNEELEEKNSTISRQKNDLINENKLKDSALNLAISLQNLALAIRHAEKSIAIPIKDSIRENIKAHLALVAYQLYLDSTQGESKKLQSQVYSALYLGLQNMIKKDSSYKDSWPTTPYQNTSDHLATGAIMNSNTIYLTAEDKKLYSFDLVKREKNVSEQLTGNKLISLEAGPRSWLTANTLSKKLLFINNANRKEDTVLNLTGIVRTSKFSPDGSILYVYTRDSVLSTINLSDKKIISKQKINFRIEDIAISNSKIYALTNSGDVVIWNTDKIPFIDPVIVPGPVKSISGRGTTINCKPDNSLVVWGNDNGEVFYLENKLTNKAQYLTKFGGPVTSIAFNFSLNLLAIASYDKSIQVFSLPNLQSDVPLILNNNQDRVSSIFFQKNRENEDNLVAVIGPGIIRIYPMSLKSLACKVSNFYKDKQPGTEDLDIYFDKEIRNKKVAIKCN